jgi:hypothetical protein
MNWRRGVVESLNSGLALAGLALVRSSRRAADRRDELLSWMRLINPGMLWAENVDLITYCIAHLPSEVAVLEIGSFAGLSLNHIIHFLRKAGRSNAVFSVDEWKFEGFRPGQMIDGSEVAFDDYRSHVIDTFRRNVTLFSSDRLPHHIELGSDAFFSAWRAAENRIDWFGNRVQLGGPISFAYIDGDHSYEQSKRDFENVDRFLEIGGFIIFDDSADSGDFGCKRTAREVAIGGRYELVDKSPNYCLRKLTGAA